MWWAFQRIEMYSTMQLLFLDRFCCCTEGIRWTVHVLQNSDGNWERITYHYINPGGSFGKPVLTIFCRGLPFCKMWLVGFPTARSSCDFWVQPVTSLATVWSVLLFCSSCCIQPPFTTGWCSDGEGTLSKSLCRLFGNVCREHDSVPLHQPLVLWCHCASARLTVLFRHSRMCLKCTCEHYEHTSLTFLPKFHVTDPCLLFYLFPFHACCFPLVFLVSYVGMSWNHFCDWLCWDKWMSLHLPRCVCVPAHFSVWALCLWWPPHHVSFVWCTRGPSCLNVIACCLHAWRRDWGSDGEGRLYPGSEWTDLHGNGLISVSGPPWHCPPHWWIGQCLHSFCLLLPGRWAQKQGKLCLLHPLTLHGPCLSDWRV